MNASGVDANIVARVAECIATAAHSGRPVPPVRALLGTDDLGLAPTGSKSPAGFSPFSAAIRFQPSEPPLHPQHAGDAMLSRRRGVRTTHAPITTTKIAVGEHELHVNTSGDSTNPPVFLRGSGPGATGLSNWEAVLGDLSTDEDPAALARFVVTFRHGLAVMACGCLGDAHGGAR
jgi:hypothetical protein